MNPTTDEELLLLLKDTEHSFVERKVFSDSKDWLKTVVGFANSAPVNYPTVLFIGARNDGTPEKRNVDLDSVQGSLSEKVSLAYPTIYYNTRILGVGEAKVLAVIVPGSPNRPHFAGPAYIREGSKTVQASREQFDTLIALRNSKAYEILKSKGNDVSIVNIWGGEINPTISGAGKVINCNQHYVTLDCGFPDSIRMDRLSGLVSIPLNRIELSFDHKDNRLELIRLPA